MKLNLRIAIESIVVSLVLLCIYFSWPILQGYFITRNHVPDMLSNYESVNYLQSSVVFGSINNKQSGVNVIIGVVLAAAVYYGLRSGLKYLSSRKGSK